MYKISIFMDNIQKYGNCKFYGMVPNPNANTMIDLSVLENGKLSGTAKLEVFDRVYWDGVAIDENARKITSIELAEYVENTLPSAIAALIYGSIYDKNSFLIAKKIQVKSDTTIAVNNLYSIASAMLQLTTQDVVQWARLDEIDIKKMLIRASKKRKPTEMVPEQAIWMIENDMRLFVERLASVSGIEEEKILAEGVSKKFQKKL